MTTALPGIRPDDQRYDYSDPAHWWGCGEEDLRALRRALQGWRGTMADVINKIEAQHGGIGAVGEGWVARGTMPGVLQQYLAAEGISSTVYDVSGPGAFMPRLRAAIDRLHYGLWMGRAETYRFTPDPRGAGLHYLLTESVYVDCGQPWGGVIARYSPMRMEAAALWFLEVDLPAFVPVPIPTPVPVSIPPTEDDLMITAHPTIAGRYDWPYLLDDGTACHGWRTSDGTMHREQVRNGKLKRIVAMFWTPVYPGQTEPNLVYTGIDFNGNKWAIGGTIAGWPSDWFMY